MPGISSETTELLRHVSAEMYCGYLERAGFFGRKLTS